MQTFYSLPKLKTPLVHTFLFSEDCEFNSYHVRKPSSFSTDGFYVSADFQCEFDEPNKYEDGLTAHITRSYRQSYNKLIMEVNDYVVLKYPGYYRGLCALAKNNETTAL